MKPTIAVCDCDPDGSLVGTVCKAFGGQCVCLPGVRGRQCDECRPGTYDLSPSGCTGKEYIILVEMLQHLWASGSSQILDYIACKFIPAASKECQQKKSIILQKYRFDTREW